MSTQPRQGSYYPADAHTDLEEAMDMLWTIRRLALGGGEPRYIAREAEAARRKLERVLDYVDLECS